MGQGGWAGWIVGLVGIVGCAAPSLDLPGARGSALRLTLEPAADLDAAPAAFRGRLRGAPAAAEPWLFRGELSDHYDRAIRQRDLSAALLERAVPLRFWRDEQDVLLQPLIWLQPDERYALALVGYGRAAALRVSSQTSARAMRFFPAAGASQHQIAVLCGADFAIEATALTLEPGAVPLQVTPGAYGAAQQDCVTLVAERSPDEAAVAPPALAGVLLEPSVFMPSPASTQRDMACAAGVPAAGACLEVLDDRAFVTSMGDDALWLLEEPKQAPLALRAFERTTLLRGLDPNTRFELRGQVISSAGVSTRLDVALTTVGARRHLVLNEVLADALGPEPASEWIEVVNDSGRPAELSGIWLEDSSGRVPLPDQRLEPGETALLVAASFRASGIDVAFPEAARVLELPSLGQRGLSNAGEALLLVGREGVLSRFPMVPAVHAGTSIARRSLDAADDSAQSFAEHGEPGASPGAANFFE